MLLDGLLMAMTWIVTKLNFSKELSVLFSESDETSCENENYFLLRFFGDLLHCFIDECSASK